MKKKSHLSNTSDDLRKRAEENLKKRIPGLDVRTQDDAARLIHELEVHQIELEMQNEELRKAQVELEESRSRYSDLYDFAPMGYFVLDSNALITNLNLTGAALLGVERGHLTGKPFNAFVVKEDKDQFYSHRRKLLGVQGKETCEIRLCRKDGTVFYAQLQSQAMGGSERIPSQLRIAVTDITERKQAAEELQKAQERTSAILESITDAFVSIDHDWHYTYVNHSAAKLLGKTREQMLGNVLWEVFPEVKGSQFDEEFHKAVTRNVPVQFEAFYPPRNAWYECRCYPSSDGLSIFFTNVNERKETQNKIENLSKFPSENPNPVLRISSNGTVLYSNAAGSIILETWQCRQGERIPQPFRQQSIDTIKSGKASEYEITCSNGSVFSVTFAPVVSAGYVNAYGHNVTKRKEVEQEILNLNQKLEERVAERTAELEAVNKKLLQQIEYRIQLEKEILLINERAQRLIGQELHDDVGQLFTGTALMLKVLQKKITAVLPDEASYLEKIMKLVEQAISHTRHISKALAPMNLEADNLVLSLTELAASAEDLGIHCTVRGDRNISLPDTAIALNLYRIAQEAINNAIKHGKAGTIQVELTCDSNRSKLTVESDGLDFPEVLPESKGMGLKIMHYRSELINGSLDIHRGADGGTIVTCIVPNQNS